MSAYPSLTIGEGSAKKPRSGRTIDTDGDGYARARKLHGTRYDFELVHPGLNTTDLNTFLAFVVARDADNASFTLTWLDGNPYQVQFDEPPFTLEEHGAQRTTVRVSLLAAE